LGVELRQLKGWEKGEPLTSRLAGKVSGIFRSPPLRQRMEESIYRLNSVRGRLNEFVEKLERRDRECLEKCVGAYSTGDKERARIYASECSEIRKMVKTVLGSQLALEQAALRLETIKEFGDTASILPSISKLVKSLRGKLEKVMPDVAYQLGEVDKSLGGLLSEVGAASATEPAAPALSGEAEEILKAASLLAEQRVKEKFPSLPVEADEHPSTPST